MPYTVALPDGRTVQFPDSVPHEQAASIIKAQFPTRQSATPEGSTGIGSQFVGGLQEMGSSLRTAGGAAFGDPNEAARAGLERQKAIEAAHPNDVSLAHLKDTYNNQGLWEATKEVAGDVPKALARMSPQLASGFAGARLGAMGGAAFGPADVATVPAGAILGGIAGFALPDLIQRFGGNIEQQAAQQEAAGQGVDVNRGAALGAAAAQVPLDAAAQFVPLGRTVLGKVLGPGVQKLLGQGELASAERLAQESLKMSLAKGTAVGLLEQVPIQVAQSMIGRLQSGQSLTGDDAMRDYGEAAYMAGMLSPLGAYGRLENKSAARTRVEAERLKNTPKPDEAPAADAAALTPDEATILGEAKPPEPAAAPPPKYEFKKTDAGKNDYASAAEAVLAAGDLPANATRLELIQHIADKLNLTRKDGKPNQNLAQGVIRALEDRGVIEKAEDGKFVAVKPEDPLKKEWEQSDQAWNDAKGKLPPVPARNMPPVPGRDEAYNRPSPFSENPEQRGLPLEGGQAQADLFPREEAQPEPEYTAPALKGKNKFVPLKLSSEVSPDQMGLDFNRVPPSEDSGPQHELDFNTPKEAPSDEPTQQRDADVAAPDQPHARADRGGLESDIPFTAPADPASDIARAAGLGHADDAPSPAAGRAPNARKALKAKKDRTDVELARRVEEIKANEEPPAPPPKDESFIGLTQRLRNLMGRMVKTHGDDSKEYSRVKELHDAIAQNGKPIINGKANPNTAKVLSRAAPVVAKLEEAYNKPPKAKPVPTAPEQKQKVLKDAVETKDLNQIMSAVVANSRDSHLHDTLFGHLADTLNQMDLSGVRVLTNHDPETSGHFPEGVRAVHYPSENAVAFHTDNLRQEPIVHEVMHAATANVMSQYLKEGRVGKWVDEDVGGVKTKYFSENKQQTDAAAHIVKIFDTIKNDAALKPLRDKHGEIFSSKNNTRNLLEFIAHAMTNPAFQKDLAGYRHKALAKYTKEGTSLWTQFTNALARLFRMGDPRGNALLETSEAVHKILTQPGKVKFDGLDQLHMARKVKNREGEASFMKDVDETAKKAESPEAKAGMARRALEEVKKPGFYNRLATNWQDVRRPLKVLEDAVRMADRLITDGAGKFNDAWSRISMSASRAHAHMVEKVDPHIRATNDLIVTLAKDMGISPERASTLLSKAFIARHEGERRHIKYLLNVPLSRKLTETWNGKSVSPATVRDEIMKQVYGSQTDFSPKVIGKLREKLELLAKNHADPEGHSKNGIKEVDPAHRAFDVIGDHPPEYFKEGTDWLNEQLKGKHGETIKAIDEQLKKLKLASRDLDRQANYWTNPVENIVNLYGYEHYVPYKGVVEKSSKVGADDDMLEIGGKRLSGEYADIQHSFEGRQTDSENAIHQIMADATIAAMHAGRAGVTEAIKNLIKSKYIHGEALKPIAFKDRYTVGTKSLNESYKGKNVIYHYTPSGDIEVYKVTSDALREAIRRTYTDTNPLIDLANNITSKIGSFHTRYNVAFHPYNFVRDAITNSFVIGAEHGLKEVRQVLGNTVASVFNGGIYKAGRLSTLFRDGKTAEIEQWAKRDSHVRDMYDFLRNGRVTFASGMTTDSQFKRMVDSANKPNTSLSNFNKYVDTWSESFELAGRAAAFSAVKRNLMAKGRSEETAINEAAAYTKNLANFESVGRYGKEAGALFMFFRPSATGAVRAIDSILPAIMSADKMSALLPHELLNDPEALATFKKNHAQLRKQARLLLGVIAGAGAGLYTMALAAAQKDELGRNEVATDNMSIWQRNARMPLSFLGKDYEGKFMNLPWGFGFGALGSAGAQMAAAAAGNQSMWAAIVNTGQIAMDSFLPLPVSKIDPSKDAKHTFAFVTDSLMPSALRPFFEYAMNTDALGRSIYSDRLTKYGASYSGGENIPEIYKDTARMLHSITSGEVDMSPNTMYFFANNYADGMARLAQSGYGLTQYAQGKKSWDTKNDFSPLSSFIGKTSPIDSRQFADLRDKMDTVMSQMRGLKERPPDFQARYLSAHPTAPMAVTYYNKQVNGQLRRVNELRSAAIASPDLTAKERKAIVDDLTLQQHMLQRTILDTMKIYGYTP